MKETLKTSFIWTILITIAVAFTVTAVVTKGFGLWNFLIPDQSGVQTGYFDKREKLEGLLFFSSAHPESDTVRIQRLVVGGRVSELETFVGASKQNYGFHKYGDLLMQTEWIGRFEEKHKVVLRQGGEVLEEIFFPDEYIAESALSPEGDVLALVMSRQAIDFTNKKASSDARVYLYELQSKVLHEIGPGVSPQWDSTGNYVTYVSSEGVMVYNRIGQEAKLGIPIEDLVLTYGMSAVSSNGKSLAIVDDTSRTVKLYRILGWDTFTIDIEVRSSEVMSGALYSPLFSPRDRYVAFLVSPWEIEGVASTTKVWTYDQARSKTTYLPMEKDESLVPFMIDEWVMVEQQ